MTDRELLELAAKAAEIEITAIVAEGIPHRFGGGYWNPLTDDGDALRLAVRLGIGLDFLETASGIMQVWANHYKEDHIENAGDEPYAATRRAIVRAAAEIGRSWTW